MATGKIYRIVDRNGSVKYTITLDACRINYFQVNIKAFKFSVYAQTLKEQQRQPNNFKSNKKQR